MRNHLGLGLAMVLTAACSSSVFTGEGDAGQTGDAGKVDPINGGDDGGKVDAVAPPGCDQSKLPTDDACVVNDAEGVFVSSSMGAATGDGSRAKPLASLDAAIARANQYGMRVYACAETYTEPVAFADGTSVFGYFDCKSGWTTNTQSHAKIQSPTSPAATATNITHATRVEAVDIVAPDFTDKSQSSIALIANGSPALLIKGATIHAGTGGKGADGANAIQLTDSGTKNGQAAWGQGVCSGSLCPVFYYGSTTGGTNVCTGESGHNGGPGGNGGQAGQFLCGVSWVAKNGGTLPGSPTTATIDTAAGGNVGLMGSSGVQGATGQSGSSGDAIGVVSASGYVSADGSNGTSGAPGQGGGGAGGYNTLASSYPASSHTNYNGWGEAGGAGGAGGCPGLAATSGKGGGVSLAVLAIASGFTLDTVAIQASVGGAAGAAGLPSAPTLGGSGGAPVALTMWGGDGGPGGYAGISGNGGGGPSIGIAYQGTQPTLSASTVKQGVGGAGVLQRTATSGQIIPASSDGLSKDVYAF